MPSLAKKLAVSLVSLAVGSVGAWAWFENWRSSEPVVLVDNRAVSREVLEERSIPHLDLRPAIREADTRCYWRTDHHLNLDGHRVVARRLLEEVRELVN